MPRIWLRPGARQQGARAFRLGAFGRVNPSRSRMIQRASISTATTARPLASPIQMPTPCQSRAKASQRADAKPDDPIADQRKEKRHRVSCNPRSIPAPIDLRAVDQLERGSNAKEADGKTNDDRVRRCVLEK